jgi:DNA polymerase-3 subunit epsilon
VPCLEELTPLVVDCQTTGATPALGAVLEVGWVVAGGEPAPVAEAWWVKPPVGHRVPRVVRRLTGVRDADLEAALDPGDAWRRLRDAAHACVTSAGAEGAGDVAARPAAPTLIHFARFELEFLRDLHARFGGGEPFPLDVVCVHAIAERLFPDLPRRGLRPLTGYLGRAVELANRSGCHADATAYVWRQLVPALAERGVRDWAELRAFVAAPRPPRGRRAFPLPRELRRSLPDRPGVYRFLRSGGDVLYVGKATSLKKRVAGHFAASAGKRAREVALEMLTQARDLSFVETATALEAALLEADEIKRLDPPYNVHLREGDRRTWFASRDLSAVAPVVDDASPLGPIPSRLAVAGLAAMRDLLRGEEASTSRRARAVLVPDAWAPDEATFAGGWALFVAKHALAAGGAPLRDLDRAGRALWWVAREQGLDEAPEDAPDGWDDDRVRRDLERAVLQGTQLLRRARWLALLASSRIEFREPGATRWRTLTIRRGEVEAGDAHAATSRPPSVASGRRPSRRERQAIDAATYDRLRVITSELKRVLDGGGDAAMHVGRHAIERAHLARLLRWV